MTIATQVLTYIKQNNQLFPEEIKITKEQTLNIFTELKLQMDYLDDETGIFKNRYAENN